MGSWFTRSGRGGVRRRGYRVFYTSDVHGSEQCWGKFLAAGRFYGVEAVIMGGDLIGKAIVPIEQRSDGSYVAEFLGETVTHDSASVEDFKRVIRFNGMYPWIGSPEEVARSREDDEARGALFQRVMLDELGRWISLGDQRLTESGIVALVMAGNDDPLSCDAVIEAAQVLRPCDGRIVLVGDHEVLSSSWSNPTPWRSPRELEESDLYDRLKPLADQLENPRTAIFNLHVPPFDSSLDTATELNERFEPVYKGGKPKSIPVGSTAVRQLIEELQPMVSLHGHIHESRGITKIGRTLAINPGSDYTSGRLQGVVLALGNDEVVMRQLVVG